MDELKLSKFKRSANGIDILENEYIVVDTEFMQQRGEHYLAFKNCTFQFTKTGKLKLVNTVVKNCVFQGVTDFKTFTSKGDQLEIISCKEFENNTIKQQFENIFIQDSYLLNFNDESITNSFRIQETDILNFTIIGCTRTFNFSEVLLQSEKNKSSLFNKKIDFLANCNRVNFDNVKVNPFYLATKCDEKSSIDLTGAILIDDWSRLRKKYAGLSLFIIFVLTLLFFLPLFTHSFFLLVLRKAELLPIKIEQTPLWKALLFGGKNGWEAIAYSCLTFALLFYNIGRLILTVSISKLREEENFLKDANFEIVSVHPNKYKWILNVDKILSLLFWVSIIYSLLKLIDTLMILVPSF